MAGHNKWSKIARKKGVNDQKRGKIFTKIIREITVSAKTGGPDADSNPRLRSALILAKSNNMPKDVIDRAIKKGCGDSGNVNFEEISYEAYGPGGTALLIKCLTDNKNRTVGDVRHIVTKYGGKLGSSGSVSFLFEKKGIIEVNKADSSEEQLMEIAIDAGADDVRDEEDTFEIITKPEDFEPVRNAIEQSGVKILSSELTMSPTNTVKLDSEKEESMMKMMEALEDNDDIQNVYTNCVFQE